MTRINVTVRLVSPAERPCRVVLTLDPLPERVGIHERVRIAGFAGLQHQAALSTPPPIPVLLGPAVDLEVHLHAESGDEVALWTDCPRRRARPVTRSAPENRPIGLPPSWTGDAFGRHHSGCVSGSQVNFNDWPPRVNVSPSLTIMSRHARRRSAAPARAASHLLDHPPVFSAAATRAPDAS